MKDTIDCIIEVAKQVKDIKRGETLDIKCPKCGNIFHIKSSKFNGHLWGECETKDCFRFFQ